MNQKNIRDLVVLDSLVTGPPVISANSVKASYTVTDLRGISKSTDMIFSYQENVFDPDDPFTQNLASLMVAQVAMNYGLFFKEIIFDGLYDDADKQFIIQMTENTSREIVVNKILAPNVYLLPSAQGIPAERLKKYTAARLTFRNTAFKAGKFRSPVRETDPNIHVVLSSGGKDSLLSYGLLRELGKEVHPVFVNESGRHWFTALNTYRELKASDRNTLKVWTNSDRVFNWMLRQLPFIRPDFQSTKADYYPIRLWTVMVFIIAMMPLAMKRRVSRIIIGNEYDTTVRTTCQGITHYNSLYDQSRFFDHSLSRYFRRKGWNISQFSVLRCLSEMLILKILVKRYPDLQKEQISCHAAHIRGSRVYPCGACEKCRRIVGMLCVLDADPRRCGYDEFQIINSLKELESKSIKQIGSDASQLYYLLMEKKLISAGKHTLKMARANPQILQLRFDRERSQLSDIPKDLREPLISIYLKYADGAVRQDRHRWEPFDVLNSPEISLPFLYE